MRGHRLVNGTFGLTDMTLLGSGCSLKFWAFLVGHGAPPASTRVIGAGLQDLHLPPKQTNGTTLAFIGRDFDRKGGVDVLRAFRILKGRHASLQ